MANLNTLLVNESFIDLSAKLKNQNVFDMLKVEERETIHSRFLAYLLDPNATHGIGTGFLEVFLLCLSEFVEQKAVPNFAVASLDLDMASVTPEWVGKGSKKRVDVVLEIPYKKEGRLVLAIECKVNAGQGKNQLTDYDDILQKNYPQETKDQQVYKLYLTRSEDPPEGGENWGSALWQDLVYKSLVVTKTRVGNALSSKMLHLLEDFKSVIESWSEQADTQGIDDLCQSLESYSKFFHREIDCDERIYLKAKHREAYERLCQYFKDPRKPIRRKFDEVIREKQGRVHKSDSNNQVLRFWPTDLERYPLSADLSPYPRWTKDGLPILFEIFVDDYKRSGKLRVRPALIVGPMLEQYQAERIKLISDLREKIKSDEWTVWGKKEPGNKWAGVVALKERYEAIDQASALEQLARYIDSACRLVPQIEAIVQESPLCKIGTKVRE